MRSDIVEYPLSGNSRVRVFLTGGTGFVGSAIARALVRQGAEVHALVRPAADRRRLEDLPITWHEGDIIAPLRLNGVICHMTYVIHAAGRLGEAGVPEDVYRQTNVEGTRNVLEAAMGGSDKLRVLLISSPGVLGPVAGQPASEDTPLAPSNSYEESKAAAEEVAHQFIDRGLSVLIARPEFIYGPGDRHVLGLFQAVMRGYFFYIDGGRHFCHPTYIDDAVDGILSCLNHGQPGQTYHITGPRPVSFRELVETIASVLGVPPPRFSMPRWLAVVTASALEGVGKLLGRKAPLSRTAVSFFSEDRRFSYQKANSEIGYSPRYDIASGIFQTSQWYRARGWL
jgi:nucleoside-diphosphate-sugar epimerase